MFRYIPIRVYLVAILLSLAPTVSDCVSICDLTPQSWIDFESWSIVRINVLKTFSFCFKPFYSISIESSLNLKSVWMFSYFNTQLGSFKGAVWHYFSRTIQKNPLKYSICTCAIDFIFIIPWSSKSFHII